MASDHAELARAGDGEIWTAESAVSAGDTVLGTHRMGQRIGAAAVVPSALVLALFRSPAEPTRRPDRPVAGREVHVLRLHRRPDPTITAKIAAIQQRRYDVPGPRSTMVSDPLNGQVAFAGESVASHVSFR